MIRAAHPFAPFFASLFALLLALSLPSFATASQDAGADPDTEEATSSEPTLAGVARGLKFRSIGPALMSGRISDIAIDPVKPNTWYVAAGSGNLWKTVNAGTTWTPIFDDQGSYS
ncbi:MAG: hypothetical protein AB8G96_09850, partial [Phycisphaerales bacterium]